MDPIIILQLLTLALLVYLVFRQNEGLCVKRDYGYITEVPASVYADANSALVHSSSLGQAPLGDPRFWIPSRSPITQGQYGLYQPDQPFDRSEFDEIAKQVPVYTDEPLPPQCQFLSG